MPLLTALVLGCNGQDGTLVTRRLLRSGKFRVIGVGRQKQSLSDFAPDYFSYRSVDLARDPDRLADVLADEEPDRVFHLAAVHGSATTAAYEPIFGDMLSVNVRSVHCILEYARSSKRDLRFMYASSAKVFGRPLPAIVREETPRVSTCLYSLTKNASADLIEYYRNNHGVAASQAFLFNHESELRPAGFFFPKLTRALLNATRGQGTKEEFSNLRFHCDWGSADEYMGILVELLERFPREDFVVASGRTEYALNLVERLFSKRGLRWENHIVELSTEEGADYSVDISKLRAAGLAPSVTAEQLVDDLLLRQSQ